MKFSAPNIIAPPSYFALQERWKARPCSTIAPQCMDIACAIKSRWA